MKRQRPPHVLTNRIVWYLTRHEALDTAQLFAWCRSVTRNGGYTLHQFDEALRTLRDEGLVQCVNGRWYLRPSQPRSLRSA